MSNQKQKMFCELKKKKLRWVILNSAKNCRIKYEMYFNVTRCVKKNKKKKKKKKKKQLFRPMYLNIYCWKWMFEKSAMKSVSCAEFSF